MVVGGFDDFEFYLLWLGDFKWFCFDIGLVEWVLGWCL